MNYPDFNQFEPAKKYQLINELRQLFEEYQFDQDRQGREFYEQNELRLTSCRYLAIMHPPEAHFPDPHWERLVHQPLLKPALMAAGISPEVSYYTIPGHTTMLGYANLRQVERNPVKITASKGILVEATHLIVDEQTLVYLYLLGGKTAVRANWAALKQGKRVWLYRSEVKLQAEEHHLLEGRLKCGWEERVLIHKQASFQLEHLPAGNPILYLMQDPQERQIPPSFMPALSKHGPIPVLPEWQEHLWLMGCFNQLIQPVNRHCVGHMAWRVNLDYGQWSTVIQTGLQEGEIAF